MSTTPAHTILVRFNGFTHLAVDQRTLAKASRTSGHEEAALSVLKAQGVKATVERAEHLEKVHHVPRRPEWEQVRVYVVTPVAE